MTPQELKQILIELYGTAYGSQRRLAADIGRHEVSVSRWISGTVPIDRAMARAIRNLVEQKNQKAKKPSKSKQQIADMF